MGSMVKKQPLISIIVTAYNYADFIEQAVESAIKQTYKNTEIIIINDGSSDDTDERISKYSTYKNIVIVSRENKGVIYTRNEGVRLARGEFVMQLDADDYLERTYVEKCVKKAIDESLDIVYTQVHVFGRADFNSEYIDFDLEKLKHDNYIHATSLVRKKVLDQAPYDTYLDKLGYEDWDLFLNLCLDGVKAGLVNEPLLNYRKHSDRKSRADNFAGLFQESLVRHHIWSKQNSKHPDQFWYFSSQIDMLAEVITLYEEKQQLSTINQNLQESIEAMRHQKAHIEKRDLLIQLKKLAKKMKHFLGR